MTDELRYGQEQLKLAESRLACMVEAGGGHRHRDVQLLLAKTKQELRSFNNQLNETRKQAEEHGMLESSAALVE